MLKQYFYDIFCTFDKGREKIMGRVFISYSHANVSVVKDVYLSLSEYGILMWFDEDNIKHADLWDRHIKLALASCSVFLCFHSKEYEQSPYCRKEFEIALDRRKKGTMEIIIVSLDDVIEKLKADDSIGQIQRFDFDYRKESHNDLVMKLINDKFISICLMVSTNKIDISGLNFSDDFLHGISVLQSKYNIYLKLLIDFIISINELKRKNQNISNKANFSSLVLFFSEEKSNERKLVLVGSEDYQEQSDQATTNNYLKNLIKALFGLRKIEFAHDLNDQNIIIDESFGKEFPNTSFFNKVDSLIKNKINIIFKNFDINTSINDLFDLYSATIYLENIILRLEDKNNTIPYEITPLVLEFATLLYIENNGIKDEYIKDVAPKIKSVNADKGNDDALSKIMEDSDFDNVFIYGNTCCGKSTILIHHFFNHPRCIYLNLREIALKENSKLIRSGITSSLKYGYNLDFNDLYTYSTFSEKPVVILLDDYDYLSEELRSNVLEEISLIAEGFKIIIASCKRNSEEKLSLRDDSSIFKNFIFLEILPLDKSNIIAYLSSLKFEHGKLSLIETLDESDSFFTFFDNFSKLHVFYQSTCELSVEEVKELISESNSEISIYQQIIEGNNDFSISKRISKQFNNTILPIEDIIIEYALKEMQTLKKISYFGEFEDIRNLKFKDLNCNFSILDKIGDHYEFSNDDIKSYFIASYVHSESIKLKTDYQSLNDLYSRITNDYNVLKYLHELKIDEVIDQEDIFIMTEENEFLDFKYALFKINQYSKESRLIFSRIATIKEIPDNFFFGAENIKTVVIPKSVKKIGRAAFSNMSHLENLVLSSNQDELVILPWAILNCPMLKMITLNKSYHNFLYPLTSQCPRLEKIKISEDNEYFTTLLDGAMLVSKDKQNLYFTANINECNLHIPKEVCILNKNAVAYLSHVKKIYIHKNVRKISTNFADFCKELNMFVVEDGNPNYYSDYLGLIFQNVDGEKVLFRAPTGIRENIIIPSGTTIIGSDSVSCCYRTKYIFVPKSVRILEDYAFADTDSLEKIEFEDINNIDFRNSGQYIFLSTNKYLNIIITDEGEQLFTNVHKFNKTYNGNKMRALSSRFVNLVKLNLQKFTETGFEVINDNKNSREYPAWKLLRAINLFENETIYSKDELNILLIGMTEYNAINGRSKNKVKKYLDDLINSKFISLIVFTRDLPMINELLDYKANVAIVRTAVGSTSAKNMIITALKKLEEKL